jgi:hypothetical protein
MYLDILPEGPVVCVCLYAGQACAGVGLWSWAAGHPVPISRGHSALPGQIAPQPGGGGELFMMCTVYLPVVHASQCGRIVEYH